MFTRVLLFGVATALAVTSQHASASSHREAPFIAGMPRVDGTDFYMFRSYESGREGFVTLIANYNPLQDAYGGPNYFALDPEALYEIHIDNDGDAVEDLTFQFRFEQTFRGVALDIGAGDAQASVGIPLIQAGPIGPGIEDDASQNRVESYTVDLVRGARRSGNGEPPTELLTEDVVVGDGPAATPADTVDVRYTGTLWTDGSVFDSSWSRGDEPIQFPLSGVIDGFSQGIEGMAPGGRRVIVMPPDLAYGEDPQGGAPGGTLVFVVDLVAIA